MANVYDTHVMYFGMFIGNFGPNIYDDFVHYTLGTRLYGGNQQGKFVLRFLSSESNFHDTVEYGALAAGGSVHFRPLRFFRRMVISLEYYYANEVLSFDAAGGFTDYSAAVEIEFSSTRNSPFLFIGTRTLELLHERTNEHELLDNGTHIGFGLRGW